MKFQNVTIWLDQLCNHFLYKTLRTYNKIIVSSLKHSTLIISSGDFSIAFSLFRISPSFVDILISSLSKASISFSILQDRECDKIWLKSDSLNLPLLCMVGYTQRSLPWHTHKHTHTLRLAFLYRSVLYKCAISDKAAVTLFKLFYMTQTLNVPANLSLLPDLLHPVCYSRNTVTNIWWRCISCVEIFLTGCDLCT